MKFSGVDLQAVIKIQNLILKVNLEVAITNQMKNVIVNLIIILIIRKNQKNSKVLRLSVQQMK